MTLIWVLIHFESRMLSSFLDQVVKYFTHLHDLWGSVMLIWWCRNGTKQMTMVCGYVCVGGERKIRRRKKWMAQHLELHGGDQGMKCLRSRNFGKPCIFSWSIKEMKDMMIKLRGLLALFTIYKATPTALNFLQYSTFCTGSATASLQFLIQRKNTSRQWSV